MEGKGLSTNDFTTELKNKLNGIEAGAQVNTVTGIKGNAESAYRKGDINLTPANIGAVASSNGDASNTKVTFTQSTSRVNLTSGETLKTAFGKLSKWFVDLKAVAFSGSYNDLSNKPTTLKNPKSLTIQQNGGNQTEYDGSTALTVNITKAGIGLNNVENKSSATIRDELTSANVTKALGFTPISKVTVDSALSSSSTNPVQNKVVNAALSRKLTKTINEYNAETICLCRHSKSGTVHTLVKKNSNDYYSTVKFVATADFTYGDTFRLGSASSPTVVTPKTEDGKPLNTGAFKKGSVVIAYTGDTTETVNTLFLRVAVVLIFLALPQQQTMLLKENCFSEKTEQPLVLCQNTLLEPQKAQRVQEMERLYPSNQDFGETTLDLLTIRMLNFIQEMPLRFMLWLVLRSRAMLA